MSCPLTLRLVKGSKLTFAELDNNFIALRDCIDTIDSLDTFVTGGTFNPTTNSIIFSGNTDFPSFSVDVSALNDGYWTAGTGISAVKLINSLSVASGDYSVAEGSGTTASGYYSHAEGIHTRAIEHAAHAEGGNTTASGNYSHAEGHTTTASGDYSHAEGRTTTASGDYGAHAEGDGTKAIGNYSHAEGELTQATGKTSHAEGYLTGAHGDYSHSEGFGTLAIGLYSHAEGAGSVASGQTSHAEGFSTASGLYSHAEGQVTTASGRASHSEGHATTASGEFSHAEGGSTIASGTDSHAEGNNTTASGDYSHAGGLNSTASGTTSFIHSTDSLVTGDRSVVLGGVNITGDTNDTVYVPNLNIGMVGVGAPTINLGIDSAGYVVTGTTGGGSATIDPYNNVGSASTLTWDVSGTSTNYKITLTGNTNLTMTNVRDGDSGNLIIFQDGVGNRGLTFVGGTHYIVNGGGGNPILTVTAGAKDIISFTYDGDEPAFYWTIGYDYT